MYVNPPNGMHLKICVKNKFRFTCKHSTG